jgi:hypothetical protein
MKRGVASGEFRDCDSWEMANVLWTTANSLIQSESTETRRSLRRKPIDEVYWNFIRLFTAGLRDKS